MLLAVYEQNVPKGRFGKVFIIVCRIIANDKNTCPLLRKRQKGDTVSLKNIATIIPFILVSIYYIRLNYAMNFSTLTVVEIIINHLPIYLVIISTFILF